MTINKTPITFPLTVEARLEIERAARHERARAIASFAHGIAAALRRILWIGRDVTVYLPAGRGRLTA